MLTLLDACGQSTAPATASRTPAANQDLTIHTAQDGYVVSGPKSYLGMYPLNVNVYEPLVALQPDYSVVPILATRWERVGTNTFRFHLRPGVRFHDGSPLRAADVKYTFDRIASAGGGVVGLGPDSTVVVDDATVDVTPKRPNLRVVEQIVHPQYSILKEGTVPGPQGPGTGPFEWVEYTRTVRVKVKQARSYWGKPAGASSRGRRLHPGRRGPARRPRPARSGRALTPALTPSPAPRRACPHGESNPGCHLERVES